MNSSRVSHANDFAHLVLTWSAKSGTRLALLISASPRKRRAPDSDVSESGQMQFSGLRVVEKDEECDQVTV